MKRLDWDHLIYRGCCCNAACTIITAKKKMTNHTVVQIHLLKRWPIGNNIWVFHSKLHPDGNSYNQSSFLSLRASISIKSRPRSKEVLLIYVKWLSYQVWTQNSDLPPLLLNLQPTAIRATDKHINFSPSDIITQVLCHFHSTIVMHTEGKPKISRHTFYSYPCKTASASQLLILSSHDGTWSIYSIWTLHDTFNFSSSLTVRAFHVPRSNNSHHLAIYWEGF